MRVRINPNYGKKKLPVSKNVNPVAKANNRKSVGFKGTTWPNKATVTDQRLNQAFNGGRPFPKAKKGQGGAAMGAISRRSYLNQTASRYPLAASMT